MSMNFKGDLLELLQSRVVSLSESIDFSTPQPVAPFVCTITMRTIFPGEKFTGEGCSTKKEAEKSAARVIMQNPLLVDRIRRWTSQETIIDEADVDALSKGRLLEIFQKKGLPLEMVVFHTPQFVSPFQCTIKIPEIFPTNEFVGYPCRTKKGAEKSAAQILLDDEPSLDRIAAYQPIGFSAPSGIASDTTAAAKGRLLEILQKKGIPTDAIQFVSSQTDGHFRCTIRYPECFGEEEFSGDLFTTKKAAEKSAAQVLLNNEKALSKLCHWTPHQFRPPFVDPVVDSLSSLGDMTIAKSEAKGKLLELLQKRGYPPSSAVFNVSQNESGMFLCLLTVTTVLPNQQFIGGPCTTKKEAEKDAAHRFLLNKTASAHLGKIDATGKAPQSFLNLADFGIN